MNRSKPLLEMYELRVEYPVGKTMFAAVEDVSCSIDHGLTLGIVGPSGSGKSTLARAVLQLIPLIRGRVLFDGVDLASLSTKEMKKIRSSMQMIFQDPGGSLNEYMRVGAIISEPLLVHGIARGKQLAEHASKLLIQVGLDPKDANRFPHEFSGGQKQRIAIARAIALQPKLLVCDEPTSSLDVSVQAMILNLLSDLRDEMGLTMMFITHDLAVVHQFCDEVVVMNQGKIVERGSVDTVIHAPEHSVTRELLASC